MVFPLPFFMFFLLRYSKLSYRGSSKGSYGSNVRRSRSWFSRKKKQPVINKGEQAQTPIQNKGVQSIETMSFSEPESPISSNKEQCFSEGFQVWVHSPLTMTSNSFDAKLSSVDLENPQNLAVELYKLAKINNKLELQLKTPNDSNKALKRFKIMAIQKIPEPELVQALQQSNYYFGNLSSNLKILGFLMVPISE